MKAYEQTIGDLQCIVIDGSESRVAVVVCHGYGAPGDDLVPLGVQWAESLGDLAEQVRFVFPHAPHTLAELGMSSARAWWPLNMQRLMQAVQADRFDELHAHEPPGLDIARTKLSGTIDIVMQDLQTSEPRLVLGGFSQGAMLSMDVALRGLQSPPDVLLQMSGTLICESIWDGLADRLQTVEVLQSHGTLDPVLPFSSAEALHALLRRHEVPVRFLSFHGPHTIGPPMLEASTEAIEKLVLAP